MRVSTWLIIALSASTAFGQATLGPKADELAKARKSGVNFLKTTQNEDGSWTAPKAAGITCLVTYSLVKSGLKQDDPVLKRAYKHILANVKKDGGIYVDKSNHRNYETCLAVLALSVVNKDGRYKKQIEGAEKFLRGLQWDEGEGLSSTDAAYGGAGYGSHERPDMSNTQFFVEALRAAGAKEDDPDIQKALKFISRGQNLESEHNTLPYAGKINDGGFYYTPAAGGETKSEVTENGGLRSYGSMTYAGLKSMIYAGLNSEDKRVKAAFKWIQKNYSVDQNPGVGLQGLFYYYHTFAKALSVLEIDYVVEADGTKNDWRKDVANKLIEIQYENGSWLNKTPRWYEGDPNLVTAYSLLALSYCEPKTIKPGSKAKKSAE
ncbi:MAG: prenyltransferase/squalene oxidase repeat-containing protein [Planctomycetaceae bacterium]